MKVLATLAACAITLVTCPRSAGSQPTSEGECEAAFQRGVELAGHGQLVKARAELESCQATACGEAIRHRCMLRGELIVEDTPTVVFSVTDDDDAPVDDVRVSVDRLLVASKIDGLAIPIEPGVHEVTFYKGETVLARKQLVILQGQRNRIVAVRLDAEQDHASDAPIDPGQMRVTRKATSSAHGSYVPSYLVLGVGVTGIGGAALLTKWGRDDNSRLAECAPNCPQAGVDHIRRLYLAADVSIGVGITAFAVGSWLAWHTHSHHAISVQPTRSGAMASISGAL